MMQNNTPFILFKYPSRGRRDAFFDGLKSIVDNLYDTENYGILCTFDTDDEEYNTKEFFQALESYERVGWVYGHSINKIHAINKDLNRSKFDLLVCMSDDMRFTSLYFDKLIRHQFDDGNFDKLIHIPDNDAKGALATMYIAGKDFYNRFGYIYNPVYQSLFADNEIMEIAQELGKYHYVDCPGIITHLNPAYGHAVKDEMFIRQQEIGYQLDQVTYLRRKAERLKCTTEEALMDYATKFNERK